MNSKPRGLPDKVRAILSVIESGEETCYLCGKNAKGSGAFATFGKNRDSEHTELICYDCLDTIDQCIPTKETK